MSRKSPVAFLALDHRLSFRSCFNALTIISAVALMTTAKGRALATQIDEAKDICAFFERSGLQGDCNVNPQLTTIEITLTGFYDAAPECPSKASS